MSTRATATKPARRDRPEPHPYRDPCDADPDGAAPPPARTWWERNAISFMATFSLVMLIFVITFQMAC